MNTRIVLAISFICILLITSIAGCGGGSFGQGNNRGDVRIRVSYPDDGYTAANLQNAADRQSLQYYVIRTYWAESVPGEVTSPEQLNGIDTILPDITIFRPQTEALIQNVPLGTIIFGIFGYTEDNTLIYFGALKIDVQAGLNTPTDISIYPYSPAPPLPGTLRNIQTSEPIPNAVISIGNQQVTTDENGKFTLRNYTPGYQDVETFPGGYMPFFLTMEITAAMGSLDLFAAPVYYLASVAAGQLGNASEINASVANADGGFSTSCTSRSLSDDGRFVVYCTKATNATPIAPPGNFSQVYRHDRMTGKTQLVSATANDTPANEDCWEPTITGDGEIIVFTSHATNLVPGVTTYGSNIYLKNMRTGTIELISMNHTGTEAGNDDSFAPSVSDDGNIIAFASYSDNIIAATPAYNPQIYYRVRSLNTSFIASLTNGGTPQEANGSCFSPVISRSGTRIAFDSTAMNLAGKTSTLYNDVYVRDLVTNTTIVVSAANGSTSPAGEIQSRSSYYPSISYDGTFVVFDTTADLTNIGSAPANVQIARRNINTNSTELVSSNLLFGTYASGDCYYSSVSKDGSRVAFLSQADDITGDYNLGHTNVFLIDMEDNQRWVASKKSDATMPVRSSNYPSISGDGTCVTFTNSDQLLPYVTGTLDQLFIKFLPRQ